MSRMGALPNTVQDLTAAAGVAAGNRLMFLQWLRLTDPKVYRYATGKALQAVAPGGTLGVYLGKYLSGLGQDDDSDITDFTDASVDTSVPAITSDLDNPDTLSQISAAPLSDLSSLNQSVPTITDSSGTPTASTNTSGIFSGIATAVAALATAAPKIINALNPTSSQTILAQNAQRAMQGLPPLNADGTVMTATQLAAAGYSSSQIAEWEANLAAETPTATLFGLPWYLPVGAAALLAWALLGNKKRA
jgi:hypothetical protein